ncbi:SDR family NAD(P)-dependent oxidoreductase [Spirosoma endbachense]|uniref:Glucose 1-dehydrogenase n=1 Tax=Spirosoma endbachense TaxID=2666025 RepID=A0A6P1W4A6_9BACT|nr:3-oxoacyl-ACP reductase family protein [Spirosoma endbachense]QHW00292.1 glucose 1-dehydrogenase [Spirosoma endbachense]
MKTDMRLKNQVAIVTGAARGIGQQYCLALAGEGAQLIAIDILSCADTLAKIHQAGGQALEISADVAEPQQVEAMIAQVLQRYHRIDILINNAALIPPLTAFDQVSEAIWDRVMATNVKSMWLCSKAVIPSMRQQGKGKIINISSDTVWAGTPMLLPYVASKGAILAFTRALARELAGTGINVNCVTPGFTVTEGVQQMADPETVGYIQQMVVEGQIIKRRQQPTDLAGVVVFLASEDSDFITGQTINVDGGFTHH